MTGNVYEFTTEFNNRLPCVDRGGSGESETRNATSRIADSTTGRNDYHAFHAILY